MTDKSTQVGRIAFREEGDYWNAYFAAQDSMQDAVLLGSLRMNAAHVPELKQQFIDLMKAVFSQACRETIGRAPAWFRETPAPDSERTKS